LEKIYYQNHSKLNIYFKHSVSDFVVTEVPLYEFSNTGEHLILLIRKKELTTWEAIKIISEYIGAKIKDIGYAGLKDKYGMTIQYISIHKSFENKIDNFSHSQIKILDKTYHTNKIKMGHLKGNNFFVRFKRVQAIDKMKLEKSLEQIAQYGMANYFGFQRFGIENNNHIKGKEIQEGILKEKNKKLKQMYQNAYQSYLFNQWLTSRINLSHLINNFSPNELKTKLNISQDILKQLKIQQHFFKILPGEIMGHYPYGKIFSIDDIIQESNKFYLKDRVPTGLLAGKRVLRATNLAQEYEKPYDKNLTLNGVRRYAWIFVEDIQSLYKEEQNWLELNFYLPKGSYATTLIEELTKSLIN
jgi:tRNA pseudouridine13 synthase